MSGERFQVKGLSFVYTTEPDDDYDAPWEREDGHGVISGWTDRKKAPGERVLCSDRGKRRFYDVQATQQRARRDWGCEPPAAAAEAVAEDFERMRAWCNDEWHYVGVIVRLLDVDGVIVPGFMESVWGIESDCEKYIAQVAGELAEEIAHRLGRRKRLTKEWRIRS